MAESKKVPVEFEYSTRVRPVEYEIEGVFLRDLFKSDFISQLISELGDIRIISIALLKPESSDPVLIWHKNSEDSENGLVTVAAKDKEFMDALVKALDLEA